MTLIRIDVLHQVHAVAAKMMPRTASGIATRLTVVLHGQCVAQVSAQGVIPLSQCDRMSKNATLHLRRFLRPYASCTRLYKLFYVHSVKSSVSIRLALLLFFPQQPLLTRSN
jgi:hypothetical protein